MTGHYTLERFNPSYAVFGSRCGELLVVDRATRASYYAHDDNSGMECDKLAALDDEAAFNETCGELIDASGTHTQTTGDLPPSVDAALAQLKARGS